jgi:hypothetical protein
LENWNKCVDTPRVHARERYCDRDPDQQQADDAEHDSALSRCRRDVGNHHRKNLIRLTNQLLLHRARSETCDRILDDDSRSRKVLEGGLQPQFQP